MFTQWFMKYRLWVFVAICVVLIVNLFATKRLIVEPHTPVEGEIKPCVAPECDKWRNWDFSKFSPSFQCSHPNWCDSYYTDTPETQAYIYNLQNPRDCHSAKFFVYPSEHSAGVGSALHVKSQFMGMAVQEKRVFIIPDSVEWEFGRACKPATAECYFMPLTNCSLHLHAPNWQNAPEVSDLGQGGDAKVVKLAKKGRWGIRFVPDPFKHKDYLWWHAQINTYIARPNAKSIGMYKEAKAKVFPGGVIPHPIINMYVRHGDKYIEADPFPFSSYMNIAKNLSILHNITQIYIGTEDPGVLEQTKNPEYASFTFYYIKTKRYNGGPQSLANVNKGIDLMHVSLADLFIQSQGDVFIGTRTSNWCRLIDELRKTSGKARIPFYSPESWDVFIRDD